MRQNNYYKTNSKNINDKHSLICYSFRTKKTTMYTSKNNFGSVDFRTVEHCESNVKNKFWSRISYKEFLTLLKDFDNVIPKINDTVYYDHVAGFKSNCFLSVNLKTKHVFLHTIDNMLGRCISNDPKPCYTFEICEKFVTDALWKHITKEQAFDKFKVYPKTTISNYDEEFDDTYEIQCFINDQRKYTNELTEKEAYNFRNAAERLYRYLTDEYNLQKYKKG